MQRKQHARAFKKKYRNRFKLVTGRPVLHLLFHIIRSFDSRSVVSPNTLAVKEQRLYFQFDYTTRQHPIPLRAPRAI